MPNKPVTLADIYNLINEFRDEMKCQYVTQDRFKPVESLAYGMAGLILMAVATAILAHVVKGAL